MRQHLLVLGALVLAGCWDFAALKRDFGKDKGDLSSAADLGGVADLAVDTDLSITADLAVETDLAMPMPDLVSASDLTILIQPDLVPPADLRPLLDFTGGCLQMLPPIDNKLYVDALADDSSTSCGSSAPCNTLAKALTQAGSGSTPTLILMMEGTYFHAATPIPGQITIMGGFFGGGFSCRDPQQHLTVINGTTSGQPTLHGVEAFGAAPTFDGLTINGPPPGGNSVPVTVVRFEGLKSGKLLHCRVTTHPEGGGTIQASIVTGVEAVGGELVLDGTEVRLPPMANATVKRAVYLCGANVLLRDSKITATLDDTTGGAAVEALDDGTTCTGGSKNNFNAFRSVIVSLGGTNKSAVSIDWPRNARDDKMIEFQRSVVRASTISGASTGLYIDSSVNLRFRGSSANGGLVGQSYGIWIYGTAAVNPIVDFQDSIVQAGSMPLVISNVALSSASGFKRNLWNMNSTTNVIDNNGSIITKATMQSSFQADMTTSPWGDARFGDPKFQLDGFHLTMQSSAARDQALLCWGTEGGMFQFDIDGTPNGIDGICDLGGDEFQ